MLGLHGLDGLRQSLGFLNQKKMIWGCFWDYNVGHHPLKTLNE
jgi:hypothetical protein